MVFKSRKNINYEEATFPSLLRRFPAAVETLVIATWRVDGDEKK